MRTRSVFLVPILVGASLLAECGCGSDARVRGCPDPVPILQTGEVPSGFVRCSDGLVHRETVETCVEPSVPGNCQQSYVAFDCVDDSDCSESAHGACVQRDNGCFCEYGCATDTDCGGGVCVCASGRARCVPADCTSSADCGDGLCALESGREVCGARVERLACLGDSSACRTNADCSGEESGYCPEGDPAHVCRFIGGEWSCAEPPHCGGPCG